MKGIRLKASAARPYDTIEAGDRLANSSGERVDEGEVGVVTHNLGTDEDGCTVLRVQLLGAREYRFWRYRPGTFVELRWSTPAGRAIA